jgi:hypothetical protein
MKISDKSRRDWANKPVVKFLAETLLMTAEIGGKPTWYFETTLLYLVKLLVIIPIEFILMLLITPISAGMCAYRRFKAPKG